MVATENTKNIAVVGDEDTVIGFGLAGIKHKIVVEKGTDKIEILNSIKGLIKTPGVGFIIITQQIAETIRPEHERLKIEKTLYPIFLASQTYVLTAVHFTLGARNE